MIINLESILATLVLVVIPVLGPTVATSPFSMHASLAKDGAVSKGNRSHLGWVCNGVARQSTTRRCPFQKELHYASYSLVTSMLLRSSSRPC
jgi:hypothetical protein